MAVIDLLASFPGWATQFELLWRQEISRASGGRTYVKDLGDPLWTATYQSRSLSINELDYWRARIDAMENGAQTFYGRSLSRCRPIKHPGSSLLVSGTCCRSATRICTASLRRAAPLKLDLTFGRALQPVTLSS